MQQSFQYDVCLSFADQDRSYVKQVADELVSRRVRVFYDEYEKAELWGKDLYSHLDEVYRRSARFCIMFISSYYASKLWTNHERKSAQARAFVENQEYILPARFDDTEIPGIPPTIGYVDLRKNTPNQLTSLMLTKLYSLADINKIIAAWLGMRLEELDETFYKFATVLDLHNLPLVDLSVTPVKDMTDLEALILRDTQVSDLEPLRGLTRLEKLGLRGTQVSNLDSLRHMTSLRGLFLSNTQVSDLEPLKGLTELQELDLRGTEVNDLGPLRHLTRLRSLYLGGTQVSNLEALAGLTSLEKLGLKATLVTSIGSLAALSNLRFLSLRNTQVSELEPLKGLTRLQELKRADTPITQDQIDALRSALPNLVVN